MKKILFLIPPSEGKNSGGKPYNNQKNTLKPLPISIAQNITEKDVKATGARFYEAQQLHENIENSPVMPAIFRYNGVMFSAIDYENMNNTGQRFFDEHFRIISAMYGIVKPKNLIANYKLPASSKGIYAFWGDKIFEQLCNENPDYIVSFLPNDYEKFFRFAKNSEKIASSQIFLVNFYHENGKKISHGVKKIKGIFIKNLCENPPIDENWENYFEKIGAKMQKITKNVTEIRFFEK